MAALATALVLLLVHNAAAQFVHPGGMHTQADFDRMKAKVAANQSPWVDSYNKLTPLWLANLNMPWAPVTQTGVTATNYPGSGHSGNMSYYYVVAAVNNSGTSANSVGVSACPVATVPASVQLAGGSHRLAAAYEHQFGHNQLAECCGNGRRQLGFHSDHECECLPPFRLSVQSTRVN